MKLCIPEDILKQHMAVLGKTGAGKSSALRHVVEHLLDKKKRVCVVDPKGDWWGLKKSADGREVGYGDVICFGDFKNPKATDIPINEHSGKQVAELIANGNRPCIIGFRGWMTGRMIRFWIDFASTLFTANSGELYLVGDEFHNFAPKGKIMDPEAGKCLHWSNRLMSEGRGYGLVCLIASQRPQKVHNDTLTCCETLVAMRVIHKSDRDAAQDWIEGCGDMSQGKEVLNSLAGMARGEAYVWSPEIGFGPQRVNFPMFETFDSFAPPQLQKKVSDSGWSAVDLDEVKDKLSAVIKEQQANDPSELKKRIRELEKQLSVPQKVAPPAVKEVSILTDEDRKLMLRVLEGGCDKVMESFEKLSAKIAEHVADNKRFFEPIRQKLLNHQSAPKVLPVGRRIEYREPVKRVTNHTYTPQQQRKMDRIVSGEFIPNSAQQRIIDAIAWLESIGIPRPSNNQIGAIALIDPTGGYYSNMVGPLSNGGLIERGNGITTLTDAGRALAQPQPSMKTLDDYHEVLRGRVRKMKSAGGKTIEMLNAIIDANGDSLASEQLGQTVGIDHTGGYFSNMIGPLSTVGLIERRGGMVSPTEILFPKGLS